MRGFVRIITLSLSIALTARADPIESVPETPHWIAASNLKVLYDNSDPGHAPNYEIRNRSIISTGTVGPIVVLSCKGWSSGGFELNTAIQLDPDNPPEDDHTQIQHLLHKVGILTVDGKRNPERFLFHPQSTKIFPFSRQVPKQLYNATINGSVVTLKFQGKTQTINLPGADDVFVDFAKSCPVTNGGNLDLWNAPAEKN